MDHYIVAQPRSNLCALLAAFLALWRCMWKPDRVSRSEQQRGGDVHHDSPSPSVSARATVAHIQNPHYQIIQRYKMLGRWMDVAWRTGQMSCRQARPCKPCQLAPLLCAYPYLMTRGNQFGMQYIQVAGMSLALSCLSSSHTAYDGTNPTRI